MINICNKIIVQTFKIILRMDTHFEVRKSVHGKLTRKIIWRYYIYNNVLKKYFTLDLKNSLVNILEWEHHHWQNEEQNDIYYDLPSTLLLDEFAFKSHSLPQNGPFIELRINLRRKRWRQPRDWDECETLHPFGHKLNSNVHHKWVHGPFVHPL